MFLFFSFKSLFWEIPNNSSQDNGEYWSASQYLNHALHSPVLDQISIPRKSSAPFQVKLAPGKSPQLTTIPIEKSSEDPLEQVFRDFLASPPLSTTTSSFSYDFIRPLSQSNEKRLREFAEKENGFVLERSHKGVTLLTLSRVPLEDELVSSGSESSPASKRPSVASRTSSTIFAVGGVGGEFDEKIFATKESALLTLPSSLEEVRAIRCYYFRKMFFPDSYLALPSSLRIKK